MCVCVRAHVCVSMRVHTNTHTCTHTCTHIQQQHAYTHTNTHTHTHTHSVFTEWSSFLGPLVHTQTQHTHTHTHTQALRVASHSSHPTLDPVRREAQHQLQKLEYLLSCSEKSVPNSRQVRHTFSCGARERECSLRFLVRDSWPAGAAGGRGGEAGGGRGWGEGGVVEGSLRGCGGQEEGDHPLGETGRSGYVSMLPVRPSTERGPASAAVHRKTPKRGPSAIPKRLDTTLTGPSNTQKRSTQKRSAYRRDTGPDP